MTTVIKTSKILVHAPLASTFEYVSDLSRHPEWSRGLRIEAVTPDPIAVGKEYISHGEVALQKDRSNTVRISQYKPSLEFGFVANDPHFGDVLHRFTFREQDQGLLIVRTMTLTLNPIIAFLFSIFVYPLIGGPAMKKSMAMLKMKLEENVTSLSD